MLAVAHAGVSRRRLLALAVTIAGTEACFGRARTDDAIAFAAERAASGRDRVLLGAWVPGGPEAVRNLELRLERALDIEHWYQGWGAEESAFDLDRARQVSARGAIPLVTWEPWDYRSGPVQQGYALRHIAAGRFDDYVRANARQMRRVDGPVWLRFAHEMNGQAYPWSIGINGNTAGHYVKAWRRVVRIFRAERASNVRFVWCPDRPAPQSVDVGLCFPGDAYVSYVGMDGYNAGTAADWGGWLSFEEVFGRLYRRIRRISRRPVIIAETGCAEQGGDKAAWIRNAFGSDLAERFPAVRAVVWFNEAREADWRVESSARAMTAARRSLNSGPFG